MAANIKDPHSEQEAREKIEAILPDPDTRRIYLSMLADSLVEAHFQRGDNWAVTNTPNYPDSLWLQVGHYAALILEDGCSWLALDRQLADVPLMGDIPFNRQNHFGWEPDTTGAPAFKDKSKPGKLLSLNGYYRVVSIPDHQVVWPSLRRLHIEFLYKVKHVGQPMLQPTREGHLPGVLKYLRTELGREVPNPVYSG